MKTIQVTIEVEEDPLAFEVGMPAHLTVQSEIPAQGVVAALLHAAESIQRQIIIQTDEVDHPETDPEHRATLAGLTARLAMVDSVMHLPAMPVGGFVIDF